MVRSARSPVHTVILLCKALQNASYHCHDSCYFSLPISAENIILAEYSDVRRRAAGDRKVLIFKSVELFGEQARLLLAPAGTCSALPISNAAYAVRAVRLSAAAPSFGTDGPQGNAPEMNPCAATGAMAMI